MMHRSPPPRTSTPRPTTDEAKLTSASAAERVAPMSRDDDAAPISAGSPPLSTIFVRISSSVERFASAPSASRRTARSPLVASSSSGRRQPACTSAFLLSELSESVLSAAAASRCTSGYLE